MPIRLRAIATATAMLALGCAHAPRKPVPDPTPTSEPITSSPTGVRERQPGDTKCAAVHNGQCFDSADAACEYAGCGDRRCEVLESSPARVMCTDER